MIKINPISIYKNSRISANAQSFTGAAEQEQTSKPKGTVELQPAVADYGVKVPVSYKLERIIDLPDNLKACCYKLSNGQRVVIVPKNGTTVIKTYVNTGSMNEPDKLRGISHYIEHNLFNGSQDLGDKVFFDEVNKMGAETNASTSFSVTDYYIASELLDDNDLENGIKLHAGMIQSPKFPEEKLLKEKAIVDSEINRCLSDESSRAESITLKNLFNIKSDAPDLVAGSTDNIDALTRQDVTDYFNNNYYPANMVTVITGEVDPDKTIGLVSKYFNSNKTPSQPRHHEQLSPIESPVRRDLISNKKEGDAQIFMGFAGPENSNLKDKVYMRAVENLFAGLANSRVKDLKQKYSADVELSTERLGTRPEDKTAKLIGISVSEDNIEPLLKDMYGVISNLSNNPPTEDEFQAIKNKIKKENDINMQCSHALNYHIGNYFLNGIPDGINKYNDIIDNMTYEDFINTAKKYFDLNKVSITVVHPAGTKPESLVQNYENSGKISFTGTNKKAPVDTRKIEEYTLPNNFDVILQDENSDVVNYSLLLDTNAHFPRQAAVSDILHEMMKHGTSSKTNKELSSLYDKYGIDGGILATDSKILLFGDFPEEKAQETLGLFTERLYSPNFTQENFDRAVEHCLKKYMAKEPSAHENFDKALYKNTSLAATNKEKLESLPDIKLEDVKQLYSDIINNSQGRLVVTGPFSAHPELKQIVFNNSAALNTVKPKDVTLYKSFEPLEKAQVFTVETKRNQAEVLLGYKFKQSGNMKDTLDFALLNTILGGGPSSRLFKDLREKRHLCYAVSSNFDTINDIGTFGLSIETTTNNAETGKNSYDNIQKSIEGFNDNIKQITSQKVSDEELERAKKTLKTEILSEYEMNDDKNSALLTSSGTPYGVTQINKALETIDSITPDDILNTAKYVFSSKPVYSISATKDALDANKDFLDNLAEK